MPTLSELDECLMHLSLVPHGRRLNVWYRKVDEILDMRPVAQLEDILEETPCP